MLELNETVPLPLFYLFCSEGPASDKYKTVKSDYGRQYKMLSVCLQKMLYGLFVIQNRNLSRHYSAFKAHRYKTIVILQYCFILPSPKAVSCTALHLVQWVNERISNFFLHIQIKNFPLDTSEIRLNVKSVTPNGVFSAIQKHMRKYSLQIFKD